MAAPTIAEAFAAASVAEKLEEACMKNGKPVTFNTPSGEYDICLIIGGVDDEFTYTEGAVRKFLEGRGMLVVGSTFGKWTMPVPTRMLRSYIVVELRCLKAERRFGWGPCEFFFHNLRIDVSLTS